MNSETLITQIVCRNYSLVSFNSFQFIHITNMEFIGCGGNRVKNVELFVLQDAKFKGEGDSGTALELIETTAQIVNSTFTSNRMGKSKKGYIIRDPVITSYWGTFLVGGAIIATHSKITISQSKFENNGAEIGGAIFAEGNSIITMNNTIYTGNQCTGYELGGGALHLRGSIITITNCYFEYNIAIHNQGGVLLSVGSIITIEGSEFHNNTATNGGVLGSSYIYGSTITIQASEFHSNTATKNGGVILLPLSTITVEASKFHNNTATDGGVLYTLGSTITIEASKFHNNTATNYGGVLGSYKRSTITISDSNFTNNSSPLGAVIYASENCTIKYHSSLLISNNSAVEYAIIYLVDSEYIGNISGNATFSNNFGSLVAFNSNITLMGYAMYVNNVYQQARTTTTLANFQQGGAITLFQSNLFFDGVCS